jgi:hypothetical protein
MSDVGWAILLVGIGLSADVAWAEFREWKSRRKAARRGRTVTARFSLRRL